MSLQVCQTAPNFEAEAVVEDRFTTIRLHEYRGKYVILFFYPLDFTFVCPTEIIAFDKALKKFHERNAELIGISVDSKYTHLAWRKTDRADGGIEKIRFPLVSDIHKSIARDYQVLIEELGHAARGLFILDRDGIVKHITVNHPDIGRNVDEILRTLDAIQYAEEHGEVCPANWEKGAATIQPDPELSKLYFSKAGTG